MSSGANTLVTILGETPRVAARAITDAYSATVYGSPSKNGRSLRDSDFENLSDEIELFVRSLDGEFVVIVESEKAVLLWEVGRKSFPRSRFLADIESANLRILWHKHNPHHTYHLFVLAEKVSG